MAINSYALEKFYCAVYGLATGQGAIRERLNAIYNDCGLLMVDTHDNMPNEFLNDLRIVKEGLKDFQSGKLIHEQEMSDLAGRIFKLYYELVRLA